MRASTLSGLSSFLLCSFLLRGSEYPRAHWPSPRLRRAGRGVGESLIMFLRCSVLTCESRSVGAPLRRRCDLRPTLGVEFGGRGPLPGSGRSAGPTQHAGGAAEV